jgi:hypothetical protein
MTCETDPDFYSDPESFLGILAGLFVDEGKAREVAVLANSQASVRQIDYDNWDGGINIMVFTFKYRDGFMGKYPVISNLVKNLFLKRPKLCFALIRMKTSGWYA